MLSRIVLDGLPGKVVYMGQQIVNCVVNPVIVPLCIGTVIRITLGVFHKADLVLGRENDGFQLKPGIPHYFKRIAGHGSGNGLCREIKNFLTHLLPHGLNRGKER